MTVSGLMRDSAIQIRENQRYATKRGPLADYDNRRATLLETSSLSYQLGSPFSAAASTAGRGSVPIGSMGIGVLVKIRREDRLQRTFHLLRMETEGPGPALVRDPATPVDHI